MDLYEEFLALIDVLNQAQVNYALCGGIAVAFYGFSRFTKDIDLLIQAGDVSRVRRLLEPRGYVFYSGAMPFDIGTSTAREVHRLSKIEGSDVLALDLLVVTSVFQPVWEEREVVLWRDRQVQIVSREGLALMKRVAGREQDQMDLRQLGLEGRRHE